MRWLCIGPLWTNTLVHDRKKKHSASEIMEILREAEDDAKDTIIQEFFMKEDF